MRERTTVRVESHGDIAERISRYVTNNDTFVQSVDADLSSNPVVKSILGDHEEFLNEVRDILNESDAPELNGKRVLRVRDIDIQTEEVGEIEVVVEDV